MIVFCKQDLLELVEIGFVHIKTALRLCFFRLDMHVTHKVTTEDRAGFCQPDPLYLLTNYKDTEVQVAPDLNTILV